MDDLIKQGIFVCLLLLVFILPTLSMALHYHRRNIESKLARAALEGMSAVISIPHTRPLRSIRFENITGLGSDQVLGCNGLKPCYLSGIEYVLQVLNWSSKRFWEGEVNLSPRISVIATIMRIQAI
ncbi:hypothetical protein [Vibrio furnissii]|uniref:hypothetical protein n=1 Tax=Vibrio furnissii TaxID=29494 RepID=UPI003AA920EA